MLPVLSRLARGIGIIAVLLSLLVLPSLAQKLGPDGAPSPDGSAVSEQQLLQQVPRITGRIDIPDAKSAVLMQPAGRVWDWFHEVALHWFGAVVLIGVLVVLALLYLIIGRVRIHAGRSGRLVPRFNGFERFSHWLTAVSFVLLGLTGLNITFGKFVLRPVIGPDAFSSVAVVAKYVHNFVSFGFVLGLVLIVAMWMKDNMPRRMDLEWVMKGGGFLQGKHVSAGRFNAGEKFVFWFVVAAGIAVSVSGFLLLFPFYVTNIFGMQIAQVVHALVAVLFVAIILGHIYIGTLGIEGAFDAMATGKVDYNWAKEHHDIWLEEVLAKEQGSGPGPAPAE